MTLIIGVPQNSLGLIYAIVLKRDRLPKRFDRSSKLPSGGLGSP
jgi:ubiquinone biosynthesis protein Coq4